MAPGSTAIGHTVITCARPRRCIPGWVWWFELSRVGDGYLLPEIHRRIMVGDSWFDETPVCHTVSKVPRLRASEERADSGNEDVIPPRTPPLPRENLASDALQPRKSLLTPGNVIDTSPHHCGYLGRGIVRIQLADRTKTERRDRAVVAFGHLFETFLPRHRRSRDRPFPVPNVPGSGES